jgi:menaquinone-dependent protoporphyrinogen IX oxidase
MKRVLIVHESKNNEIQRISELIRDEVKHYNWAVNFKSPSDAHSPAHYMGILVGAPENLQLSECQTLGWVRKYGKILTQKSSAFFSVGSAFVESGPSRILIPRKKIIADTLSELGWVPRMIDLFNERTSDEDIRRFARRFADYVASHALPKTA